MPAKKEPQSQELEYIKDLMEDFPVDQEMTALQAYRSILSSYNFIQSQLHVITHVYDNIKSMVGDILPNESTDPIMVQARSIVELSKQLHSSIFGEALSNAGEFRQSNDPGAGVVYFGGAHLRRVEEGKFAGISPANIDEKLLNAAIQLASNADMPVASALEFYRRFVKIHPFYDGNGRIGRLLVQFYLMNYNYTVNWELLEREQKNKFLKKLNECHKREDGPEETYAESFKWLYQLFEKYVTEIEEEE